MKKKRKKKGKERNVRRLHEHGEGERNGAMDGWRQNRATWTEKKNRQRWNR